MPSNRSASSIRPGDCSRSRDLERLVLIGSGRTDALQDVAVADGKLPQPAPGGRPQAHLVLAGSSGTVALGVDDETV